MTRSNARELALHLIYAVQCSGQSAQEVVEKRLEQSYYDCLAQEDELYAQHPDKKQLAYIKTVVLGVEERRAELEQLLQTYSVNWRVERISLLARTIMELAMYEALYVPDVPCNAAIHEAVLLAKKYEEEETAAFINGVLGSFSRQLDAQPETDAAEDEPK